MWDAVGEICNMVAGNFKNKISGMGDGCMLSVPTVITGGDYSVHSMVNENIHVTLLFEGEPVVLSLEITAERNSGPRRHTDCLAVCGRVCRVEVAH